MKQTDKNLWQDPLLHFIAIGLLIFGVDTMVQGDSNKDKVIVIDRTIKQELSQQFRNQQQRQPTDIELNNLIDAWLQTELMYRQALTLGLDKNDPVIRDRLIQKTEFLFKNIAVIREPSDTELQQWYQQKVNNYQKPPRYDFEHILLKHEVENAKQQAEQILRLMNTGTSTSNYSTDYHNFVGRNHYGLKASFGDEFVDALSQINDTQWRMISSNKGWHVVRLKAKHQDPLPEFEKIKPLLVSDWRKQQQRQQIMKMIDGLRGDYKVVRELS